jgi:hypothetical protein
MAVFPNSISLPKSREELESMIEAALARLDELDGCPDLEDGDDHEPWISAQETGPGGQGSWGHGATDDREWDTADAEPWLGSVERGPEGSQISWAFSGDDDREAEVRSRITPRRDRNGIHSPALRLIDGGRCK